MQKINIIVNLGAPSEYTEDAARGFLRDFLSDPRVLNIPAPFRQLLARYIAKKKAAKYLERLSKTSVAGECPILKYTKAVAAKTGELLGEQTIPAFIFGRYSIGEAVTHARSCGIKEFNFIPMYPQNSSSMTQSAKDAVFKLRKHGEEFKFLESYHDHPLYIKALAESVGATHAETDAVIVSFHSVPLSQLEDSPYKSECEKTAELLAKERGLKNVLVGWQSKEGRGKWIEPSTESLLKKLAARGVKTVAAICPGFPCDCTETLIEIGIDARKVFLERGGENFYYVPCLNDSDAHARLFCKLFGEMK